MKFQSKGYYTEKPICGLLYNVACMSGKINGKIQTTTIVIMKTGFNNIINCVGYLWNYILFLIPIIVITGTTRYIPMFNAITDSPSDMTSDSAFSILH